MLLITTPDGELEWLEGDEVTEFLDWANWDGEHVQNVPVGRPYALRDSKEIKDESL